MNPETEGRAAAERFREDHRLGTQPLGDLVAIIEQCADIDVAVLDADPDEHGLAIRDPARGTVLIGVARSQKPMRQRSTLAHELGHVLFEDWMQDSAGDWRERGPQETRADAFARHLLVPVDGLRDLIGHRTSVVQADLSTVVQRFLVSPAIAAIALHDAGRIDETTKREWIAISTPQIAARFGWSDQYRALRAESDQRRAPQRLLARAIRGYVEGVLSAQAIATLRGIALEDAEADLRESGIFPAQHVIPWADHRVLPAVDVDLVALDEDLNAPDGGEAAAQGGGR